eukprot:CAMPEP_0172752714 /NCGR_PEP_ID=MMETSP1074-20121228/154336_1 /TAXON_ID=2916 /ORGANISM="Ceratium fusus, Strain PA161109" /LENGTH=87 /DNA_ID=CAMNT_0013585255 /DNA_START=268 /DNA_END=531 /DNA_ORIENTATION=+
MQPLNANRPCTSVMEDKVGFEKGTWSSSDVGSLERPTGVCANAALAGTAAWSTAASAPLASGASQPRASCLQHQTFLLADHPVAQLL